jgi:quinol monooxygenase YgiN
VPKALVYVDHSKVREGALDGVKTAIEELVEFIDANEPQLLTYGVYLSDDGTEMTVVHVHADPESLDFHMEVAGPEFRKFADLVTMSSIEVYGEPSEKALEELRAKARMLGGERVTVRDLEAGFSRLGR